MVIEASETSPALFTESYYIHVWDELSMKPIIYSCCENKSEKCYHELLQSLLTHATKKKYFIKSIIINDVFPQALVKRCHFYYAQNIWKKVKEYNLVKLSKEENIRRQIANIIVLPLVPPYEVDNCMEKIMDE